MSRVLALFRFLPGALLVSLVALLGAASPAAAAEPHLEMGVDSHGRTVAGIGPGPSGRTGILRLDAAGQLDRTFAGDGIVGPFRSKNSVALSLARNGDVVAAEQPLGGPPILRRFRAADGSVDRRFGHRGRVVIPIVPENRVLVQPDGHVILLYQMVCPSSSCGYLLTFLRFVRYTPRGRIASVHQMYQEEWQYEAVAMDSDGSFVVKGSDLEIGWQTFARLRPGGRIDPSLGGRDGLNIELPSEEEAPTPKREEVPAAEHMALTSDGGLVLANTWFHIGGASISRRKSTGYLDKTFGTDGTVACDAGGETYGQPPFEAIAVGPDDSILAAGGRGSCGLVRYTPSGQPDPTFGTEGRVDLEALGLPRAVTMSLTLDGDVVVGGWDRLTNAVEFARFTPDGHLDPTFGSAGVTSVSGF